MSQIYVKVQPVPITKTIVEIRMYLSTLEFGKSAVFNVDSFTTEGELFRRDSVLMEGEDYKKWTNDDAYAVAYVLQSLNYQPAIV